VQASVLFALVHMSCAGAWSWGDVPRRLPAAVAPDLDLSAGATPAAHADQVVAAVGEAERVVVAGHSYGGLVAPLVADRLRGRVHAVVVIDGLVPDPGDSGFDLRPHTAAARRASAVGGRFPPPVPAVRGHPLSPMPLAAFDTPVAFAGLDVPHRFVHCTRSDMGEQADRARARGWEVVEADAEHTLPLDDPGLCARLLLEVG
jgi:pimeloyl-ACP methyl ester carboxylesterase